MRNTASSVSCGTMSENLIDTRLLAWIGAVGGLIGAFAGGLSLLRQIRRDRVNLRVVPTVFERWQWVDAEGRQITTERESVAELETRSTPVQRELRIEVINLSSFPITVQSTGLVLRRRFRHPFFRPCIAEPCHNVYRLESHDATKVRLVALTKDFRLWHRVKGVFARTACGTVFVARNQALMQFARSKGAQV